MKIKFVFILLLISLLGFSQNGNKTIDETFEELSRFENVGYFEVTKEMFQMLSESKEASPEFKDYISKLHQLKLIRMMDGKNNPTGYVLYNNFLQKTNLNDYSRLMTKKEAHIELSFYKKESKNVNEFLLVGTNMIIYITGTIDLKSLSEFEQVMEIAGSAFDM